MNKNWTKYRLIIIAVIVIGAFLLRTIYPSLRKTGNHTSLITQQTRPELNRNIAHLILTKHEKCRKECEDITEEEIKEILHDGDSNYNQGDLNNERRATYALEG